MNMHYNIKIIIETQLYNMLKLGKLKLKGVEKKSKQGKLLQRSPV